MKREIIGLLIALVLVSSLSFATPDFNITTTAHFDAGRSKGLSDGNYETETYTDNLRIAENTLTISNKYSDRFTLADADGNTWKWDVYDIDYDYNISFVNVIENGHYRSNLTLNEDNSYGDSNHVLASVQMDDDFDMQIDYSNYSVSGGSPSIWNGLVMGDTPDWTGTYVAGIYRVYDEAGGLDKYIASNWADTWTESDTTTDTSGKLRLKREGDIISYYYWNNTDDTWIELESKEYSGIDDMDLYLYFYTTVYGSTTGTSCEMVFDNFVINSGDLISISNGYRIGSETWVSDSISLPEDKQLKNITVVYSNPENDDKLYKVEFLEGWTTIAEVDYSTSDVTESGTSVTITEDDLTSGSFSDLDGTFAIRLTLYRSAYKPDNTTVVIEEVYGYFTYLEKVSAYYDYASTTKLWNFLKGDFYLEDLVGRVPTYIISYWQSLKSSTYPLYKASSVAQGINSATQYNLSAVGVMMGSYFPSQFYEENIDVTLTIRNDNAGAPTGSIIATSTMTPDEWANAGTGGNIQVHTFVLNQTVQMVASTLYWIRIDVENWGGTGTHNYFTVGYYDGNPYTTGIMRISTNDGGTWSTSATYEEMQFMLMTKDGVNDLTNIVVEPTSQEYHMKADHTLNPVGIGSLNLIAGDNLLTNHTVVGSGYGICSGCRFAGGLLNLQGNSTDYAVLRTGALRGSYGLIASDASDLNTKVSANYFSFESVVSNGEAYLSGTYSTFEFKNGIFDTLGYDSSSAYTVRFMYADRYAMFNNVTFIKHCGATCYYSLYFYANVVNHNWKFVDCKIERDGAVSTTPAIYNGVSLSYENPLFINTTHRGNPLASTDIANVYEYTGFTLGNSVVPTITDGSGIPIKDAVVTLIPQFDDGYDLPRWMMASKTDNPIYMAVYTYFQLYTTFDNKLTAITNTQGRPLDETNNTVLYMKDGFWYDTNEHRATYYGGSNLSLRPNGYEWQNDGSDYGYILTVSADGYSSQVIFLYGNESYTDTITLESLGGLILFSPEECPMSIELIVLCILTVMAILCLFIGWYYQSPSFILLAGLFIMIVGAFILMNGIPLLTGAENSEGVITCTYDTGSSSYITILGLIIILSGLLLTVYSIF